MSSLADMRSKLNKRKVEQQKKKAQYIRPTRMQAGKNRIRLLPSWQLGADGKPDVSGDFYQDFGMHFVKDKESKLAAVYICIERTYDRECPVCEAIREGIGKAKQSGNVGMEKLLGQARAGHRVLVNALLRDGETPNQPVILELPASVFDTMVEQIGAFLDDDLNMLDPATGQDFIVNKTGTGLDTEYSVSVAPKATAVTYDQSAVTDLRAYVDQESEQGLLKATGAVTAVTGLAAPASVARISSSAGAATGTTGSAVGSAGLVTPPAAAAAAAATAAAATASGASLLSSASEVADEAEAELDALDGELVDDDAPFETDAEVEAETPPPTTANPAAAEEIDLASEIEGDADDLDDILNDLDDL